ncbi:MAG: NAD(P)H-dependent oxidoreductase subunit E [Thermofilum sp.]|nr:NAD(P)H-dependent oxidoreductase subunit E [Thermofilum sp.]
MIAGELPDRMFEGVVKTPHGLFETLRRIQAIYGYLPPEGVRRAAEYAGIPLAQAYSVATFYPQYSLEPIGKYRVLVCTGISCHLRGNNLNIGFLRLLLGLTSGQKTTKDKLFSIEEIGCPGCCSIAPVVVIHRPDGSNEFVGRADPRALHALIERYRRQETGGSK